MSDEPWRLPADSAPIHFGNVDGADVLLTHWTRHDSGHRGANGNDSWAPIAPQFRTHSSGLVEAAVPIQSDSV
jgi:hypothetical protein